jgi:RNA polymerase sigma-70 factor (ECF subfamily)
MDRLIDAHRRHISLKRDVRREIQVSDASSMAIAGGLGHQPSQMLARQELIEQVREALRALSDTDREILLLRQAELLSNAEAAEVLGATPEAASKRYGRAVIRLAAQLRKSGVTGH